MGWSLNEGTVVFLILLLDLLLLIPPLRRPVLRVGRSLARSARAARDSRRRPAEPPVETRRPIEVIAADARRLGQRYRLTRNGVSYAKSEAVRNAYDRVLGEGCDALGVAHLLGVLQPGDELDAERVRVERVLNIWGLHLDDAA
jgi:hypothetical protein